jgi:hypothetical protein
MIDASGWTAYREAFAHMPVGAVTIARALPADVVAALRERIERRPFAEERRADRGRYMHCDDLDEPELLRAVARAASFLVDGRAEVVRARCLRLTHRDYALRADDDAIEGEGRRAEATLDISAASSAEAQVVYAHKGHHFFAVPQLAGGFSLVARQPGVTRYDRYLGQAMKGRVVHRVRVMLVVT